MTQVLIVLDGRYRFAEPADIPDFTYTVLVGALTAAGMQVTKAHRGADATADIPSFNFETSVNLLDYDVIWLIGYIGRNNVNSSGTSGTSPLMPTELAAISRFMKAGGGVFATGDHDSIGADMCGHIPRVRAMRAWYGANDDASPMPDAFPRNFPVITEGRAETTQKNLQGDYDLDDDGTEEAFVWFENQSDSIPQPIVPTTSPAHPILRHNGEDVVIYPDHMHEGNTLGEVMGYDYTQILDFAGESFPEFPAVEGHRELPLVIATGHTLPYASRYAGTTAFVGNDSSLSSPKTVNTLSVYDGRAVGVGRIVTGSTFHHYVDINLTGDSSVDSAAELARTGPDAAKGEGFDYAGAETTFATIKAVFVNITQWLARPRPALNLILERSTFSHDEAVSDPDFDEAILVTVDGLTPSQFPGGGITTLSPSPAQLASWAPSVVPTDPAGIAIEPTGIASDDPTLADRLQRITFIYRVRFTGEAAFAFAPEFRNLRVDASLASTALADPLADFAWIQLVKAANPFMLDLDGGNATTWLSSDVRVFPVVEGGGRFGIGLPEGAGRAEALTFIRNVVSGMSDAEFESLSIDQAQSALSPFPTTDSDKKVYNFAVARVRLNGQAAVANNVRVFFRIFTSQTTAALTYQEVGGMPIEGYRKTPGAAPIAIPGTNGAGTEWLSFPFFSANRNADPGAQADPDNVKPIAPNPGNEVSVYFGALLDNNLGDPYLTASPISGGAPLALRDLLMGEHQCLVAQIEYAGTPIPNGARPSTSDKLAQRNIAMSEIANPGIDASRSAFHTFEIEAAPRPITQDFPPDELLLDWRKGAPTGTSVRIYMPGWNAREVAELADRFYPRHEIEALDEHTVKIPGGGIRYVPIPTSEARRTGVIAADFPLGVRKGQRFDLAVRQVTNRSRAVEVDRPKETVISREEAQKLLRTLKANTAPPAGMTLATGATKGQPAAGGPRLNAAADAVPDRGVFSLGGNRTLITDLSVLDAGGDHAVIIEMPDPAKVAAARREAGSWRETIGAFQLAIPVSVKADMLLHHLRLLSVLRWRAQWLRPNGRWHAAFLRYVGMMEEKVRALGGDPYAVPATPDGIIPQLPGKDGGPDAGGGQGTGGAGDPRDAWFEPQADDWLGETNGLGSPDAAKAGMWSGKVNGLLFDHFGDFEGFTLEAYGGTHQRFFSREAAICELAEAAWLERHVVTVITVSAQSRRVRRLLIRGYSD